MTLDHKNLFGGRAYPATSVTSDLAHRPTSGTTAPARSGTVASTRKETVASAGSRTRSW